MSETFKADFGVMLDEHGWPLCGLEDLPTASERHQWDQDTKADNTQRAAHAAEAIKEYAHAHGVAEVDTAMSDFLGNFMHLCDGLGIDFEAMVDRARFHYEPETKGEL